MKGDSSEPIYKSDESDKQEKPISVKSGQKQAKYVSSNLPLIQKKIGKPKGMGNQTPLKKTGEWCSQEDSIKILQTLQRSGRFVYFQPTGAKPKEQKKDTDNSCCNFLDSETIQIAKTVADVCKLHNTSNKNCVIFYLKPQPNYNIDSKGQLQLISDISEEQINQLPDPLKKISSMLTKKFLEEFQQYFSQTAESLYSSQENEKLITAHTICQAQFVNYLVNLSKNSSKVLEDLKLKNKEKQNQQLNREEILQTYYLEFYKEHESYENFQQIIQELLSCMSHQDNEIQYGDDYRVQDIN